MIIRSEAEKLFYDDVREKKRTATGVHYKTGSRGYVGTMRFPSDIMSRKDKYNYRKAGKVMTTNMYDEILTFEEFNQLETHEQKNRLQYWRTNNKNTDIFKAMGISNAKFYELIDVLELPKSERKPRSDKKPADKPKSTNSTNTPTPVKKEQEKASEAAEVPLQEIVVDGLHLVYHGTKQPEEIQRQLKKYIALLEEETDEFYFEMKLMQKVKRSS